MYMDIDYSTREGRQRFYDGKLWRKFRLERLLKEPMCRQCKKEGRDTPATVCDHIIELKAAPHLRLDPSNIQPLCSKCHNAKTWAENHHLKSGVMKPYVPRWKRQNLSPKV